MKENVEVFEGKDALDKLPEDLRKQLDDKKPEVKEFNKKACDDDFDKNMLLQVNKYREAHAVPALKLCKDLSKYALERANLMAEKDEMLKNDSDIGEIVGCNWSSDPNHKVDAEQIVKKWYEEHVNYDFTSEPQNMSAGKV